MRRRKLCKLRHSDGYSLKYIRKLEKIFLSTFIEGRRIKTGNKKLHCRKMLEAATMVFYFYQRAREINWQVR